MLKGKVSNHAEMISPSAEWPEDDDEEDFTKKMWLEGDSLAPYLGTPPSLLNEIFRFASVTEADVVVDVGCGDGRLAIWSVCQFGAKAAIGIEIDEDLVRRANDFVKERGVGDRVTILHGDATDPRGEASGALEAATILTFFLLPEGLDVVEPLIRRHLKNGKRVLCLGWAPRGIEPRERKTLRNRNEHIEAFLLLPQ